MKQVSLALSGVVVASLIALAGCTGSEDPPATTKAPTPARTAATWVNEEPLQVLFPTAYSAYDGKNVYKIPATVNGLSAGIVWTASDPKLAELTPRPNGQTLITTKGVGTVTITATAGKRTGSLKLTIIEHTDAELSAGYARYMNGVGGATTGPGQPCSNCHGEKGNVHSPQQTGGFTDGELKNILKGKLPDAITSRYGKNEQWAQTHQWTATDEEATGLVTYLRWIPPKSDPLGTKLDFGRGSPEFAK